MTTWSSDILSDNKKATAYKARGLLRASQLLAWPQLSYPWHKIQDGYHSRYMVSFTDMQDHQTSVPVKFEVTP